MDPLLILEAQQAFATATDTAQLTAQVREVGQRLGFDRFVYALRLPTNFSDAQIIMLDGYPEGWVERYFKAAYYDVDPVMAWCLRSILPLRWSDLSLEPGSPAAQMMSDAADYGLRDGVTMPVHSPLGELGILSFSLDAPPARAREVTQAALLPVQVLASHVHEAVRRLSGVRQDPAPELTARERECLTWAADGKTSGEIARLLGVTEKTVNFHLTNATHKLNAVSRQHGIGKAALQGLLQPKPF
jgi:DNA-binding CsgD family transcriptional regulator